MSGVSFDDASSKGPQDMGHLTGNFMAEQQTAVKSHAPNLLRAGQLAHGKPASPRYCADIAFAQESETQEQGVGGRTTVPSASGDRAMNGHAAKRVGLQATRRKPNIERYSRKS